MNNFVEIESIDSEEEGR